MDAKKKILVIDDDEDFLVVLEDGLRMDPRYDVLTVQDGYAALLAVQRELPDLVILDIRMPGPTGFEVCLALRQDPRTSRIKILIMSGYGGDSDVILAKELRADGYIRKPFSLNLLRREVGLKLAEAPSWAGNGLTNPC